MSDPVQNPSYKPSGKNSAVQKLLFIGKFALIGFLMLLLMIPMAMIQSLISERDQTRNDADWEVVRTWGRDQTLGGPVLTVPYKVYIPVDKKKVTVEIHYAHFLPETLKVSGNLKPEIRYRGIYEVLLYGVNLKVEGSFLR